MLGAAYAAGLAVGYYFGLDDLRQKGYALCLPAVSSIGFSL
jgi:hypothetical protein